MPRHAMEPAQKQTHACLRQVKTRTTPIKKWQTLLQYQNNHKWTIYNTNSNVLLLQDGRGGLQQQRAGYNTDDIVSYKASEHPQMMSNIPDPVIKTFLKKWFYEKTCDFIKKLRCLLID